jgi:hypothetical protein
VVAALAQAKKSLAITFITHAAHQNLQIHLSEAGVSIISISSPPVVPSPRSEGDYLFGNEITGSSDSPHKRSEEQQQQQQQGGVALGRAVSCALCSCCSLCGAIQCTNII